MHSDPMMKRRVMYRVLYLSVNLNNADEDMCCENICLPNTQEDCLLYNLQ